MAFVKLDCGILNSTLWVDREAREVFITALLMALPREFEEGIPQMRCDAIEPTGFVAPAGWYGFVEAAGPGIVRRALVDDAAGMRALIKLGSPDPESRSQEFDGRRMIRVQGGYLILNFMAYRELDHGNAERCRRYRERVATRMSSKSTPHVNMHADADAEAEAEAERGKTEKPTTRSRASLTAEDAAWMREFQSHYPKRAGDQGWSKALRAANARLREGDTREQMLDGARRYAEYCRATDSVGTPYVKQACTFLGPDKHYRLPWDPPASKGARLLQQNLEASRAFLDGDAP